MLSSSVVVFREVFEIVLILGVILAATRGLAGRGTALALGVGGGMAGAALVAVFIDGISGLAQGMGQEVFNALVLFTAAGFIGWTVLWMKAHARGMKDHFTKLGTDVAEGRIPLFGLSFVIALAILREGAEIVLFIYGMLAAGQSVAALAAGSVVGILGGGAVGGLLYMGLIRLPVKYFFQVTSWLLVLLVAGMMARGAGYVGAAGGLSSLSGVLWDTSWLLDDRGFLGEGLGTLVGYTARPTALQVIVYVMTFVTLAGLMNVIGQKSVRSAVAAVVLAAVLILPHTAAQAGERVYAPYVEQGELELEWLGAYKIDDDSDTDGAWKQKAAIGYGVTERWFTELYGEVEKEGESGEDPAITAVEWENRFQLTDPGALWVDVGAYVAYEHNTAGGADKGEAKLLLAKDTGQFTHLANIIAEREFGENSGREVEWGTAWSSRYRYKPVFEPGFEYYADFGPVHGNRDFDEQSHRAGPVFYGKIGTVKYDVGVLFGLSDAAADATVKAVLEYEWRF